MKKKKLEKETLNYKTKHKEKTERQHSQSGLLNLIERARLRNMFL